VKSLRKKGDGLVAEADDLAKEAEKKNNLSLLVKSNALREKYHAKRRMDDEMKAVENLDKKFKAWNVWDVRLIDKVNSKYTLFITIIVVKLNFLT